MRAALRGARRRRCRSAALCCALRRAACACGAAGARAPPWWLRLRLRRRRRRSALRGRGSASQRRAQTLVVTRHAFPPARPPAPQGRPLRLHLRHPARVPARAAQGQVQDQGAQRPTRPAPSRPVLTPFAPLPPPQVYHPNIDLEGNVCLNILREDWKPVLSVSSVIFGLQYLFLDPNPDDPLNKEAAEALRENPRAFEAAVRRSLAGGHIGSLYFPPALAGAR